MATITEARVGIGAAINLEIRAATSMVTTSVPATMASMVRAVADTKVDVVMEVGSAVATTATGEAGGVTDEAGDTEMRCETHATKWRMQTCVQDQCAKL